jgi:hypothetical protein
MAQTAWECTCPPDNTEWELDCFELESLLDTDEKHELLEKISYEKKRSLLRSHCSSRCSQYRSDDNTNIQALPCTRLVCILLHCLRIADFKTLFMTTTTTSASKKKQDQTRSTRSAAATTTTTYFGCHGFSLHKVNLCEQASTGGGRSLAEALLHICIKRGNLALALKLLEQAYVTKSCFHLTHLEQLLKTSTLMKPSPSSGVFFGTLMFKFLLRLLSHGLMLEHLTSSIQRVSAHAEWIQASKQVIVVYCSQTRQHVRDEASFPKVIADIVVAYLV